MGLLFDLFVEIDKGLLRHVLSSLSQKMLPLFRDFLNPYGQFTFSRFSRKQGLSVREIIHFSKSFESFTDYSLKELKNFILCFEREIIYFSKNTFGGIVLRKKKSTKNFDHAFQ